MLPLKLELISGRMNFDFQWLHKRKHALWNSLHRVVIRVFAIMFERMSKVPVLDTKRKKKHMQKMSEQGESAGGDACVGVYMHVVRERHHVILVHGSICPATHTHAQSSFGVSRKTTPSRDVGEEEEEE